MVAQVELRRDLGPVGIAHVGQPHCTEEDRVGALARLHRAVRERDAGVAVRARAAGMRLVGEAEAADLALERREHREARVHDFHADAVAGEDDDPEIALAAHRFSYWSSLTLAAFATCAHFSISLRRKSA